MVFEFSTNNSAEGKVTKKKESKKQEFKDIVSHIENLEDKVERLLNTLDKVEKNQANFSKANTGNELIPFSPSAFQPTSVVMNNVPSTNAKTPTFNNSNKMDSGSPLLKNPSPLKETPTSKNTPLDFLANVITNQYEKKLIREKIQLEDQANLKNDSSPHIGLVTDPNYSLPNNSTNINTDTPASMASSNFSASSHKTINFVSGNDVNVQDSWNKLRKCIPQDQLPLFDSVSFDEMFVNNVKEEKIYKLLETTQIKPIPDIKVMQKIIDIFINYCSAHILLPLESYDLLGILNKWKFDGLQNLNNSHLLILNVVGSFICKDIRTSIFLKNYDVGNELRVLLEGFDTTLLDYNWLTEWEDFFLANSLLHYQSITMFPDGLASVQGIILLLMYVPLTGLNLSESLMQTSAVRICQDLGLHSERFLSVINKNKKLLRDKKKKIWWFCCFSDEMLSMMFLKPRMIIHYTSSINFRNDDKTKVLELLEQELDKELILEKANENETKVNEEDNSEVIENLKIQLQDSIIRIYKEDGIFSILKYYFFKMINIIQKNVSKIEKKWDATILEEMLDDFIDFSNNLPLIIKDPSLMKDVWGDDCFFLYLIHATIFFIQDHSYCLLHSIDDSREYIDFVKQHLDLILKINSCKKSYNALFGIFDKVIFSRILKIVQYHLISKDFNYKYCLIDYQFLKNFLDNYFGIVEENSVYKENESNNDSANDKDNKFMKDTIQELDPWLQLKKDNLNKVLEILKQKGIHEAKEIM